MGTSGGTTNSSVSGDSSSSQQTTVDQSRNVYDDMKKTLETMLTPQKGRFWLSASTGTLTVTDTPSVLNSIAAYVEQQNRQMNRQVRLNVQVLSVSTSRKEQLGLDWNIVYKSLRSAGASLNNVSGDIANATSASVSILDTATGERGLIWRRSHYPGSPVRRFCAGSGSAGLWDFAGRKNKSRYGRYAVPSCNVAVC